MKFSFTFVLIAGLLLVSEITLGHGTEKHAEESQAVEQTPAASPAVSISEDAQSSETQQPGTGDHSDDGQEDETYDTQPMTEKTAMPAKPDPLSRLGKAIEDFSLDDFPTLHPMVVHVPVIMIPVAFLFGLISIFITNRYFVVLAVAFASAGVLGGFVAAFPMHPHTPGIIRSSSQGSATTRFFLLIARLE